MLVALAAFGYCGASRDRTELTAQRSSFRLSLKANRANAALVSVPFAKGALL